MKSHGGAGLNISDFVAAGGRVHIGIEETGHWLSVLWEQWIVKTLIELLVIIDNMVGSWSEKSTEFLIGEKSIEESNLIDGWLTSLVSYARESSEGGEGEVDLPDWSIAHEIE